MMKFMLTLTLVAGLSFGCAHKTKECTSKCEMKQKKCDGKKCDMKKKTSCDGKKCEMKKKKNCCKGKMKKKS